MKISNIKKYFIPALILGSMILFLSYSETASAADCKVISATFTPSGFQSTDWYRKARKAASTFDSNLVHIKIRTENCEGKYISTSITSKDAVGFTDIDIKAFDERRVLVHASNFEDIVLMPGENQCYGDNKPNCSYYLTIYQTSDGAIERYESLGQPQGELSYNCDGAACLDDWVFDGLDKYLQGEQVSGSSNIQETGDYDLLAPLPVFGSTFNIEGGLTPYLRVIFQLLIGIAGILSVIMIVIGGIEYMSTDAISGKEEGKERVTQAILGLIIALGSWVLLNSINPDILSLNVGLTKQTISNNITDSDYANAPQTAVGGKYCSIYPSGANWASLAGSQSILPSGVAVNKAECEKVGDSNCTSIRGLNTSRLQLIKSKCPNCELVITGGTECWLHSPNTQHLPGSAVMDLRATSSLNMYIWGKASFPNDGRNYCKDGINFLAERAGQFSATTGVHWHVQQNPC